MTKKEIEKMYVLADNLADNVNKALLEHGAQFGTGRRETYADGVHEACMLALRELFAITGTQYFYPKWKKLESGKRVLFILKN